MTAEVERLPRPRWRLNLRTLMAGVTCFAIGLSASGGMLGLGLIETASAALVIGLAQESQAIYREYRIQSKGDRQRLLAFWIALGWRVCSVAILTVSLTKLVLQRNDYLEYAESNSFDYGVEYVYLTAIVFGFSSSYRRMKERPHTPMPVAGIGVWAIALISLVLLLVNQGEIPSMVHRAVEGTEKSHPLWLQRADAYPNHAAEGYAFFWSALFAAVLACISFAAVYALFSPRTRGKPIANVLMLLLLACQAYLISYLFQVFGSELHRVSPDLAGAGLGSSAVDVRRAGSLFLFGAVAASYSMSTLKGAAECRVPMSVVPLHLSMPMLLALMSGGLIACIQIIREVFADLPPLPIDYAQRLRWLIQPYFLLLVAIVVVGARLLWLRWTWVGTPPAIWLKSVSASRFVSAFAALSLVAATGVPALSIFGFAVWFSPWVR